MKKYFIWTITAILVALPLQNIQAVQISVPADSLIQGDTSTVYYYAVTGDRYIFPNVKTYDSWFTDFSQISKVTTDELAAMPLKGNITYRPGVKLVKAQTDPKVYAVDRDGKLRWIETEAIAISLYGENWSDNVDDIPDAFFTNYQITEPISSIDDYSPETLLSQVKTINTDKGITASGSAIKSNTDIGGVALETEPESEIPIPPPPSDTTGPVISEISTAVSKNKATINWSTDELSDSKIEYSFLDNLSTAGEIIEVTSDTDVTSHSLEITGLTVGATYYFKITSTDSKGNAASSDEQSLTALLPQFIKTWGEWGPDNGQLKNPEGIAIDIDNNVYVVDNLNYRIQRFSTDGEYLEKFGSDGVSNSQFKIPKGIAVNSEVSIYVTDRSENRVQRFNVSGLFMGKWGTFGGDENQFSRPIGVATDSNNNVFVIDENYRLQKFDNTGSYLDEWYVTGTGLAIDSADNIYVLDKVSNSVSKYDSSLNLITSWGSTGSADGQFDGVDIGIAVDSKDNVYVVDIYNYRIQIFTSDGKFITKFGSVGYSEEQFVKPAGIALDTEDNVYVTDFEGSKILKFGLTD
ncbi:MAG: hypothetical protein CMI53_02710 [Parcubacteria group bacterium]|nr:hypothetical protein [Parcubacteria group bacterium]|tara:strand:- start:1278 stop:3014 length:1737 start_codon:yes stop_codon:yes gene_type:complete